MVDNSNPIERVGIMIPSGRFKGKRLSGLVWYEIDAIGANLPTPITVEFRLNKVYLLGGVYVCGFHALASLYDNDGYFTGTFWLNINDVGSVSYNLSQLSHWRGEPVEIYMDMETIDICEDIDENIAPNQLINLNINTPFLEVKVYDGDGNFAFALYLYPGYIYTSPIPYQYLSIDPSNKVYVFPLDIRSIPTGPNGEILYGIMLEQHMAGYGNRYDEVEACIDLLNASNTVLYSRCETVMPEYIGNPNWTAIFRDDNPSAFNNTKKVRIRFNIPDDLIQQITGKVYLRLKWE